jgi:hypothetical protein
METASTVNNAIGIIIQQTDVVRVPAALQAARFEAGDPHSAFSLIYVVPRFKPVHLWLKQAKLATA